MCRRLAREASCPIVPRIVIDLLLTMTRPCGFEQIATPWREPAASTFAGAPALLHRGPVDEHRPLALLRAPRKHFDPFRQWSRSAHLPFRAAPSLAMASASRQLPVPCHAHRLAARDALAGACGINLSLVPQLFFIAVLLMSIDPWHCLEHPGDTGDSARGAPAVSAAL